MVISVYSKNPGGALKFIDYATSEERIAKNAAKYSKTPTIGAAYDDPAVKKAMPFADALRQGVENAKSRPVSPVYPQISEAIFKNVNAALSGSTSPRTRSRRPIRTSTRRWPPSRSQPWKPPPSRPARRKGRRSRGTSERRLAAYMVSPSLLLIALVAAYPILYAIWLSLHEYSVRVAGLSRWAGLRQLLESAVGSRVLGCAYGTRSSSPAASVTLEVVIGMGDGAGDARRVPGPGPAPHGGARAVGGADRRHRDDVADDLRPDARPRERRSWAPTSCGSASRLTR